VGDTEPEFDGVGDTEPEFDGVGDTEPEFDWVGADHHPSPVITPNNRVHEISTTDEISTTAILRIEISRRYTSRTASSTSPVTRL
jgi:hypothetical protein